MDPEYKLKEVNDGLLSILKCSRCTDFMIPTVHMCINGHNMCGTCHSRSRSCTMCGVNFSSRNVAMEEVFIMSLTRAYMQ